MKLSCDPIFFHSVILIHIILLISAKIGLIQGHQICATHFPSKARFICGHIMHEEIK